MPDKLAQPEPKQPAEPDRCEVCGCPPPPGHRFCDNCWPDAAINAGKAGRCAICGSPKVWAKLRLDAQGRLVCAIHS